MERKYEHIFFDLDRTLWHFEENSNKVLRDIYQEFGLQELIPTAELFIDHYKRINEELWVLYRENKITKDTLRWKRFGDTLRCFQLEDSALADRIGDYYIYHSPRQTELLPYTREVLDYLHGKGYKLHIISNGFEEVQYIKMQESAINHYFDVVVLSEKAGVKKPHPYIFKKALKLAGALPVNSLMIGDDFYADILGAKRIGMDQIYFNFDQEQAPEPIRQEIRCLSELMSLL
ncbi:MAG: YjjG family noncanonical pyrimidine nucleotidase [Flavobacteriales bacterium]|nr:YjjG family noncanonical pyrimidine nucleotidase [Flavobacteriales bacterium]